MITKSLRFAAAVLLAALPVGILAGLLAAAVPADYKGKPWKGKMQTIPGRLTFAFYDEGGEGVAYHDADKVEPGQRPAQPRARREEQLPQGRER